MPAIIDLHAVATSLVLRTGKTKICYVSALKIPTINGGEIADFHYSSPCRLRALAAVNRYAVQEGFALSKRDARTLYRTIAK